MHRVNIHEAKTHLSICQQPRNQSIRQSEPVVAKLLKLIAHRRDQALTFGKNKYPPRTAKGDAQKASTTSRREVIQNCYGPESVGERQHRRFPATKTPCKHGFKDRFLGRRHGPRERGEPRSVGILAPTGLDLLSNRDRHKNVFEQPWQQLLAPNCQ